MSDKTYLHWPFFEEKHRQLSADLEDWCAKNLSNIDHSDTDELCKSLVSALGKAGWCQYSGVDPVDSSSVLDVRSLCLIRETLARNEGLADFAFAMQGLGTGAISLFGTLEQKNDWLTGTREGNKISAFALTEPQSGSDVANSTMSATLDGEEYVLNGEKT